MESDQGPSQTGLLTLEKETETKEHNGCVSPKVSPHRRSRDGIHGRGPTGQNVLWEKDSLEKDHSGIAFEKLNYRRARL